MKRLTLLAAVLLAARVAHADIILSASGLNETLKKMERLKQQSATGPAEARGDALFAFGMEADALAELLNDEVAAHGSQEKALIDLAIARTGALGASIAYSREKKKFFYDNTAFRQYADVYRRGRHAADAEFKLIEGEYFQSTATEVDKIAAASERKRAFLAKHPAFKRNSEVSLMLSIDYRDLYRHYRDASDAANRAKYLALARQQLSATIRYRGSEEARIASEILKRLNDEVRQKT